MVKRAPPRRRPRKAKPGTKGIGPAECRLDQTTGNAKAVAEAIEKAGGCVAEFDNIPLFALTIHTNNKNPDNQRSGFILLRSTSRIVRIGTTFLPRLPRGAKSKTFAPTARRRL